MTDHERELEQQFGKGFILGCILMAVVFSLGIVLYHVGTFR